MASRIPPEGEQLDYSDDLGVADVFCTKIAYTERLDGVIRFVFTVENGKDNIVVAKLLVPLVNLQAMISKWVLALIQNTEIPSPPTTPDAGQ